MSNSHIYFVSLFSVKSWIFVLLKQTEVDFRDVTVNPAEVNKCRFVKSADVSLLFLQDGGRNAASSPCLQMFPEVELITARFDFFFHSKTSVVSNLPAQKRLHNLITCSRHKEVSVSWLRSAINSNLRLVIMSRKRFFTPQRRNAEHTNQRHAALKRKDSVFNVLLQSETFQIKLTHQHLTLSYLREEERWSDN